MANGGSQLEIRLELINIYQNKPEDLAILLIYLDNGGPDDHWVVLRMLLERGGKPHLQAYTDEIIRKERSQRLKNCSNAISIARNQVDDTLKFSCDQTGTNLQTKIFNCIVSNQGAVLGFCSGVARVWDSLPKETQFKLIQCLAERSATNAMQIIGVFSVSVNFCINVYRWFIGELTSERCAKQIVDTIELGGGILGAAGGMWLGALVHPLVSSFLAVFGGVVGGAAAKALIKRLAKTIFDLPIEIATENAYNSFKLKYKASREQIIKAYKDSQAQIRLERDEGKRAELETRLNINIVIIDSDQRKRLGIKTSLMSEHKLL